MTTITTNPGFERVNSRQAVFILEKSCPAGRWEATCRAITESRLSRASSSIMAVAPLMPFSSKASSEG
jgi:hypothetical protein